MACRMRIGTESDRLQAMRKEVIAHTCRHSSSPGTGHTWRCMRYAVRCIISQYVRSWRFINRHQQILYGAIEFIATQFEGESERSRYIAAGERFRIPYWDWAVLPTAGESVYPKTVQLPSVDINGPAGLQTIANPLYSYSFHPLNTTEISTPQVRMGPARK